ncbi:MAG: SDR family oxidoreductase [Nitrospira sp.]|nr:SDR family oxidoreductase [Nitrospira sp.]
MKILITGNMGYIGPSVVQRLRLSYPAATIMGLDMGYFATCLTAAHYLPECRVDEQVFADVRSISKDLLRGVDAVVYLAAISNDPMGASFEEITLDVNHRAAVRIAESAREAGAGSFVFASSCSVYGFAEGGAKTEESAVNPLTAYAKSKVGAELDLAKLARNNFAITCLRFATACGMSERLRLDLVLNDFVASAVTAKKITILSDGTPWRPLIHIKDMARAIDWGVQRNALAGGEFLSVNVGSDQWNYQVRDLAAAVSKAIPNVDISVNQNAQPDKRSYRVSFEKFRRLAPQYQPEVDLHAAIADLSQGLQRMGFDDREFRNSHLIRLNVLKDLKAGGYLGEDLRWVVSKQ